MSSPIALKPLIAILGPTASGKTELALKLAKRFRGKIVSADSRQIYKEMDIGTAKMPQDKKLSLSALLSLRTRAKARVKQSQLSAMDCFVVASVPSRNDKKAKFKFPNDKLKPIVIKNIPHYLIDIVKPNEKFSVAEYKKLAVKIIRDIQNRGKIPILVGGTGLYISAIADNLEIPKVKPNSVLRKKLGKTPIIKLLKQLEKSDPATFKTIDKKNKRRIIRALEVTISTGKPFFMQKEKGAPLFDVLKIGLNIPREKLYKKIDARVEKMIKNGLVEETKKLSKKYSRRLPSMSGIGYKQVGMYLRGEITLEKAKELIKFATHNYARRQITWFRKDKKIKWVKMNNKRGGNRIIKYCKKFLRN